MGVKDEVRELAEAGRWSAAINMAIDYGNLTIPEIAKGLEVTQSTVGRWVRDETAPIPALTSYFAEKLIGLFDA